MDKGISIFLLVLGLCSGRDLPQPDAKLMLRSSCQADATPELQISLMKRLNLPEPNALSDQIRSELYEKFRGLAKRDLEQLQQQQPSEPNSGNAQPKLGLDAPPYNPQDGKYSKLKPLSKSQPPRRRTTTTTEKYLEKIGKKTKLKLDNTDVVNVEKLVANIAIWRAGVMEQNGNHLNHNERRPADDSKTDDDETAVNNQEDIINCKLTLRDVHGLTTVNLPCLLADSLMDQVAVRILNIDASDTTICTLFGSAKLGTDHTMMIPCSVLVYLVEEHAKFLTS